MSHASLCNAAPEFCESCDRSPPNHCLSMLHFWQCTDCKKKKKRLRCEVYGLNERWCWFSIKEKKNCFEVWVLYWRICNSLSFLKKSPLATFTLLTKDYIYWYSVSTVCCTIRWFNSIILYLYIDKDSFYSIIGLWVVPRTFLFSEKSFLGKCRLLVVQCATSVFISANCAPPLLHK